MNGVVGTYKVAYTKQGDSRHLYSKMASNIGEAQNIAETLRENGSRVVIMENMGMDESASGRYAWKILDDYQGKTARTGMVLTDGRFVIIAVMILVAALWLGSSSTPLKVSWD